MTSKLSSTISNLIWKFAERISAQAVTMIVSIILARLLEPEHYGLIALVTIFITVANVFVSDGLGNALIQKKNADALDFSSVLYFNIVFSIGLYIVLFFTAPLISNFYGEGYEILTPIMRVLSLRLILSAINSVQQAYVSKQMIFRKFFWATLVGTLISGLIGICLAYKGYGVWALVAQYLVGTTVNTVVLQCVLNVWPIWAFSFQRLKSLFSYGYKVLLQALIITGFQDLRALIIGKLYSSEDLAFYDKGKQFPNLIVTNINVSIGAVLFPIMSQDQDDRIKVKSTMRQSIRFSSYIMSPLMLGLAAVAKPFVSFILTDKWLPAVPLMQLFCIFYLFQPIQTANTQAVKALGRSDIALKLEIFRDILQLVVLAVVMWISVDAIVVSMAIMSVLFVFVNAYPNVKLLDYRIKEQLQDIFPSLGMSLVMFVVVYLITYIKINDILLLVLQIIVGALVYLLLSVYMHNHEFEYIFRILKNIVRKK